MKTSTTTLLFIFFLYFGLFAQSIHEEMDHLFESTSLLTFESDLNLNTSDYDNTMLLDIIDAEYQAFFTNLYGRVGSGEAISHAQFDTEYHNLVSSTLPVVKGMKGVVAPVYSVKALDGPCVNMDFESGDLTGWELTRGNVDGSAPFSFVGEFAVGPGPYHTIYTGGVDPVTGIPRVNPLGGAFSTRLGNGTGTGARAARMKQTFLVDSTNYMFTYSYAVVFQSPVGHSANQLPYFTVRVIDSSGVDVPCGEYSVIANAANASDYQSTNWGGSTVLYKNWETVFANLSAYIGQNVTVIFSAGDCSLSGHFGYAYVDASCGVSQLTASQDIICTGDSSILTAPVGASSYLWGNGDTTQMTTVFAGGTYSCTMTPSQGGGCSITLDITINENPTPSADYSSSTIVACVNDSIHFTDLSTIPAPGLIASYRWDFGDGIVSPMGNGVIGSVLNTTGNYTAPSHLYTAPGIYNVQLLIESVDGCLDSITYPVTINVLPVVIGGLDQTVCDGFAVTLNGAGANFYVWNNGVMDGVPFFPPVGTNTYILTGTDLNGCVNTDQVDVIVNGLPNVNAGLDQVVCEGTAVVISGSGTDIYVWDNGVFDGVPFFPPVGTNTYILTGTDLNGCVNTDQVDVTVNPLPLVDAGVDQFVCDGEVVSLSGSGANTYAWDNSITNGIPFVQLIGTVTYTLTGTDVNGCVNTDQVDITVNPLPNVIAGVDQQMCMGSAVALSGSGASSYLWDNGVTDGVPFGQPVGTVTYTVVGTDANGCQNIDDVNVTVYALPTISAGADMVICDGASVALNGAGGTVYLWDNGVLDGVPFVPSLGTLTYTVIGTDANGCSNFDDVDVTVNALPVVSAGSSQQECENFMVTLSGVGADSYVWNNGVLDGIPFNAPVGLTTYTVVGTDINGCSNSDQVDVEIYGLPNVVAGVDVVVCDGAPVVLNGSGASSYTWTGGVVNSIAFTPIVGSHNYIVSGVDVNGCVQNDTVNVLVNPNPIVNAGANQSLCYGDAAVLVASGTGFISWDNGVLDGVPFLQEVGEVVYTVQDSLSTGCVAYDQVQVVVHQNPVITANNEEICKGEGVTLNGGGAFMYSWTGGVIDGVEFFPIVSQDYFVTGTDLNGCQGQAVAKVIVHDLPNVDFNILDLSLNTSNPITSFDNLTTGGDTYTWDFGDGSVDSYEFEPTHSFPDDQAGAYAITLDVLSIDGCPGQKIKYVHVFQDYTIYVPNTFTPDGSGVNDIFKPVMTGFDPQDYTMYIFNRWGDLIFESHDMEIGWDGRFAGQNFQVQDGVYTWKIEAGLQDSADTKLFVGHVSILK
ncbi:MAG: PKD domain-containing protein [Crocinitomicaceae bacterium]|nr:PKD domain-containing protein [Crocinitomicaceae bacterium]